MNLCKSRVYFGVPLVTVGDKRFLCVRKGGGQTLLGQVVQDQTGLVANYDFSLNWTPDEGQAGKPGAGAAPRNPDDDSAASIFTALQEQLGLKLESSKGPVDNLAIEHVEKPSEN